MGKYWICLLLVALAAVSAQQGDDSYEYYEDAHHPLLKSQEDKNDDTKQANEEEWAKEEWKDDDDYALYDSLFDIDGKDLDADQKDQSSEDGLKDEFDQIEDNRSGQNADELDDENAGDAVSLEVDAKSDKNENSEENLEKNDNPGYEVIEKNNDQNVEVAAEENTDNEDKHSDENNDDDMFEVNDQNDEKIVEIAAEEKYGDDSSVYMDEPSDRDDVPLDNVAANSKKGNKVAIEDVKESIAEDEGNGDDTIEEFAEEAAQDIIDASKGDSIEGDTVDKVITDLNKDVSDLMKTWKKLNDNNNGDYVEPEKNADDALDPDQISKYEDKYGVPYGERYVLSLREQNYEDVDSADDDEKMSDEIDDELVEPDVEKDVVLKNEDSKKNDDENANKDDDGLFKDDPEADDATSEEFDGDDDNEDGNEDSAVDAVDLDDTLIEAGNDAFLDDLAEEDEKIKPSAYELVEDNQIQKNMFATSPKYEKIHTTIGHSELPDYATSPKYEKVHTTIGHSELPDYATSPKYEKVHTTIVESDSINQVTSPNYEKEQTTIDVSDLTPEEYDQLMAQFVKEHADSFDLATNDVGRNVAPIHVTLTQDPITVTSPNFPSPYPTNNIVDWVFTGEGVGIELIITDFYVNGIMGDYLLVVPGGIDASSTDGLVFSHMLRSPRKYRFLDVDQMFVRFQAFPGFSFRQGFSFTVRMVSPLPGEVSESDQPLPEPEALVPAPAETLTLLIGGLTLPQFNESLEQFREIIADMAAMYINANDIDPGLNTTREVTQITNLAVCNLNWPNSDVCSEVTFGVPLVYEDDDDEDDESKLTEGELRAMWYMYSAQDPFALRLRNLGMEEFTSPNDSGVLTVWLVIGFGLLISMVMLAFALWRFSCFENYSRMPTYSDRDSVYSKQGLDLYPTPHQTLPPLFADNEYKWDDGKFEDSSTVDLGGFTNKSYIRDELLDIDSDEEVIAPTKRDSGYQPRGSEV